MLDNESDAQALVRESFATADKFWHRCPSGVNSRVWLFKIMVKAIFNKSQRSPSLAAITDNSDKIDEYSANSWSVNQKPINDSGQIIFPAISSNDIIKAIGDLPEDIRLIVILALLEAFSYRDVAVITSLDLETVKSKLREGRDRIRKGLINHLNFEDMDEMPASLARKEV